MLRAGFAAILLVVGTAQLIAQEPAKSDATPACSFSEIYRKDGWTVPGVSGAKVKQRGKLGNISGVFVTVLKPVEAETNIAEIWCPSDHPGRLVVDDRPIRILALWSYDFDGRLFAYRINYALQTIDNGTRNELAAAIAVFFYDTDGSGRFTVSDGGKSVNGRGLGYLPSFIPDWAKSGAVKAAAE
jgi:hypothetical protein